jgi:ribosome-associated translation inhibitor RaiA
MDVDKRCGLTVRLPGRRTVHVEPTATSRCRAFTAAAEALERWIRKEDERTDTARAVPKGSPSPRRQRGAAAR